ncbi:hypothetical protein ACLB2K_004324 [Fragaria x ananassa]
MGNGDLSGDNDGGVVTEIDGEVLKKNTGKIILAISPDEYQWDYGSVMSLLRGEHSQCYKDVSFWISENFTENSLCEVVREVAGDLAEEVQLLDSFKNKERPVTVARLLIGHCNRVVKEQVEGGLEMRVPAASVAYFGSSKYVNYELHI